MLKINLSKFDFVSSIFYSLVFLTVFSIIIYLYKYNYVNASGWVQVLITAVLAEITAFFTYKLVQETKKQNDLKKLEVVQHKIKIIKGFLIEIMTMESDFLLISKDFRVNTPVNEKITKETEAIFCQLSPTIWFYPEHGVYYSLSDEIFDLDGELALHLFIFYSHLLTLERLRKSLENFKINKDSDGIDIKLNFICGIMSDNIDKVRNDFPKIKEELKNEVKRLEEEEKSLQHSLNM